MRNRPTSCCSTAKSSPSTPSRRCARRSRFATARSSALAARPRCAASRALRRASSSSAAARSSRGSSTRTCTPCARRFRFSTEVNWIGARSLDEALGRISDAAQAQAAGQLAHRRRRLERAAVRGAPPADASRARGGSAEQSRVRAARLRLGRHDRRRVHEARRSAATPTCRPAARSCATASGSRVRSAAGRARSSRCSIGCRSRRLRSKSQGTREFFRELNRLGLTGVVDPGGNNLFPPDYRALFDVWRRGELTVRVAYSLNGQTPGGELAELQSLTALLPMGFGDDRLHFNGLGERITYAMNNNPEPTAEHKERYYEIVRWAAERGMAITMHWGPDDTVAAPARDLRARESRGAVAAAALVDRAFERCVGGDAAPHGRARRRLDGAGRHVFRRRRSRAPAGRGRRATHPAGRHGPSPRRRHRRRHRRAPRRVVQPVHVRCNGSSTARRSPARRFAGPRRRRTA